MADERAEDRRDRGVVSGLVTALAVLVLVAVGLFGLWVVISRAVAPYVPTYLFFD